MGCCLGCAEPCLPGASLEEKLVCCTEYSLWLELVNLGELDLSPLESYEVEVKTVQAYLLHTLSLASGERWERQAAMKHVIDTIDIASLVGAAYVLVVPGYGRGFPRGSGDRWAEALADIASCAEEQDVKVLVEALGPRRTSFLPSLAEVSASIASLGLANIAMAGDTGHAADAGEDVLDYREEIAELHLKDRGGRPPGRGDVDFRGILTGHSWPLLCLEYRSSGSEEELSEVLEYITSIRPRSGAF